MRERGVGLGVMGFYSFLQAKGILPEGVMAKVWNERMLRRIRGLADQTSRLLVEDRGPCLNAADYGVAEQFSHKLAIAPMASILIVCGAGCWLPTGADSAPPPQPAHDDDYLGCPS